MERQVYDNMRTIEREHWWFVARRSILSDQISRLSIGPDARILEVGCGTGGNIPMLQAFGDVVGIEPDDLSRDYAQSATGSQVLSGLLPAGLPAFDTRFDLIAALDVLEHVDADAASVEALGGLLKPGGKMLTTVPAHPWMWSRHDVAHHHKRRYRKADYESLFRTAGLRILKTSYFNTVLFPAIASVRAAQRLTRNEGAGDDAMPSPAVNSVLAALFGAERELLRSFNLPVGVSILLIAERQT